MTANNKYFNIKKKSGTVTINSLESWNVLSGGQLNLSLKDEDGNILYYTKSNDDIIVPFLGYSINTVDLEVDTTILAESANDEFDLPLLSTGEYDFDVVYNGNVIKAITSYLDNKIIFPDGGGIKKFKLIGKVKELRYSGSAGQDRNKLISIKAANFGDIRIGRSGSLESAFNSCRNLITFDVYNFVQSDNTSLYMAFNDCTNLVNIDLSSWDVSGCTRLDRIFFSCANLRIYKVDWTSPITGSINATTIRYLFAMGSAKGGEIIEFSMDATNIVTSMAGAGTVAPFYNNHIKRLFLYNASVPIGITHTSLTGADINNLADTVKDMTGEVSPTIQMTTTQQASCNQSLWSNKNWTIIN